MRPGLVTTVWCDRDSSRRSQGASPRELSDALSALGAYAEPPTDTQLAAAELAEGRAALAARLANALYGSALADVMTAEVVAVDTPASTAGIGAKRGGQPATARAPRSCCTTARCGCRPSYGSSASGCRLISG